MHITAIATPNNTTLVNQFQWLKQIHHHTSEHDPLVVVPCGPSLWMGTAGSSTQCHYDVVNNMIVQFYCVKCMSMYRPSMGVKYLHVYPDAHTQETKS